MFTVYKAACFFLAAVLSASVYPQKKVTVTSTKDVGFTEEKADAESPASFSRRFDLRYGILSGPIIPLGDTGTIMQTGFLSVGLQASGRIPDSMLNDLGGLSTLGLQVNLRYSTVFSAMNSKAELAARGSADLSLIHNMLMIETGYPLKMPLGRLRPFMGLGGGLTLSSMNFTPGKESTSPAQSDSSADGTLAVSLGAVLTPESYRAIDIYFDTRFFSTLEAVSASYITVSLGGLYHF